MNIGRIDHSIRITDERGCNTSLVFGVEVEVTNVMDSPSRATLRPTDDAFRDAGTEPPPRDLLTLPWIDVHNHAHTLSWSDREKYALSGCVGMVMVASGYHWTPYKPIEPTDIRYLWDDAINRRAAIEQDHFFEASLGIGLHTGVRIDGVDALLDAMDVYCTRDDIVAIGETGVTPTQHVESWGIEDQRDLLYQQCTLASSHDLPLILHLPVDTDGPPRSTRVGYGIPGFEKHADLRTPAQYTAENPAVEALTIDIETAREAGIAEKSIVASHTGPGTLEYLMEHTDCYASFTLGHQWLLGVTVDTVAAAIQTYGPERIMLDTDCANVLRSDPFAIKRAIFGLYHRGIEPETIRTIVYENPRSVFDISA